MYSQCEKHSSNTSHQTKIKRKDKSSLPAIIKKVWFHRRSTSLFTFQKGSLTLEAACVFPLFLFLILSFLYFVKIIDISVMLTEGFYNTGKEMAVLAYSQNISGGGDGHKEEVGKGLAADMLTGVYARQRIISKSGLKKEEGDLNIVKSSFLKNGQMIDVIGTMSVKYPVTLFKIPKIRLLSRVYIRSWTGRDGVKGDSGEEGGEMVLVTVNGKVFHKDPDCTHIKLSIHSVLQSEIETLRNDSGGKYYPCSGCKGGHGMVYITDTGDRYHSSLGCSGLKRGLLMVPVSEADGWQACSRCGK